VGVWWGCALLLFRPILFIFSGFSLTSAVMGWFEPVQSQVQAKSIFHHFVCTYPAMFSVSLQIDRYSIV